MSWRIEYLNALRARDSHEHASKEVYDAYTKLADRTASTQVPVVPDAASPGGITNANQIQVDLVEAQRARGELTKRLDDVNDELEKLQIRSKDEGRRITHLTSERGLLLTKIKDRDEELKGKTRLLNVRRRQILMQLPEASAKSLQNVHDETVALTLQLNVTEQENDKLKRENKDLVDRWMARMAQEAEAMNTASKYS